MIDVNKYFMRTEQCAHAFMWMFWAFLFLLDFRLGYGYSQKNFGVNFRVDLLPDFIGWLLFACALTMILSLSSVVAKLRTLAYVLLVLSLFDFVDFRYLLAHSGNMRIWLSTTHLFGTATTVVKIVFIWKLFGLIMAMAAAVGDEPMWQRADFRRKLYVGLTILAPVAALISISLPPLAIVTFILVLPVSVIVTCLTMGLMRGTADMCRGGGSWI